MLFKYVIYLIISLLINLIKNSEIILPFTSTLSEIPKNLTPIDFMDSLFNNELLAKVKVGTPPQDLDLIINFEYYHLFLIKDSSSDRIFHKRFYSNKSSTFTNLSAQEYFYSDSIGFSKAINSSDLFTMNENITNTNFTFLHVTDSITQTKIKSPGVIGLNVISNGEPFHLEQGLVHQLKALNFTNNYNYTFVYNNNDDFKGKIIFEKNIYEEYPLENCSSCYCYTKPDYTFYWGSNFIKSFYNKATLQIENLLLKPELGVVLFNKNIEQKLKEEFLDEKIKEGKCYEGYNIYAFYYCDIDVKIDIGIFEFKKLTSFFYFSLNSDDLTMQYNNKTFLLMGFSNAIPKNEAHLGYPFFRKYDVIFDQNKRTYSFYNFKIGKKNKEETHDDIPGEKNSTEDQTSGNNSILKIIVIVLLIIISIALFLLLAFYIFRTIKRKEKSQLLEELNEIN